MSSEKHLRVGLSLEPLDTLFFRDGRPFEAGTQAASGLPQPQAVAGAMRTCLLRKAGCDFEKLAAAIDSGKTFKEAAGEGQPPLVGIIGEIEFRGPWFALSGELVVAVPSVLRRAAEGGGIIRLAPLEHPALPGWEPPQAGMLPLWARDPRPTKNIEGYLKRRGLEAFLTGNVPAPDDVISASELFDYDRRTGIAVSPRSLAADEGMIYAISLLTLRTGVSLYAEARVPENALSLFPNEPTTVQLGGEGRYAALRRIPAVEWPGARPTNNQKTLLLLTTPAFFDGGWRPRTLPLASAAVPGYVAVSGWDMARKGPKPNRFAVAAGSTYFVNQVPNPLPDSLCDGEDAALGWGTFVEGVWNHV